MKPTQALITGCLIALTAGTVGFQWGKRNADSRSAQHQAASTGIPSRTRVPSASSMVNPPADLVSQLDRISDPVERFSMALASMEAWVATDPKAALDWLTTQPTTGRRNEVIRLAISQWAESAPQDAATWSQENLTGIDLHNTLIRIAEHWARTDPANAATWFATLPESSRTAPLEGLFFAWGTQDPKTARAFLDSDLASDPSNPIYTQAVLAGWAKSAPAEASAQSLEISQKIQNPALFANTLANWATVDVSASAAWLLEHVQPSPMRHAAVQEMAAMFAHQHPPAGIDWIQQLDPSERTPAMEILGTEWARTDPKSAASWLASQPADSFGEDARLTILTNFLTADETGYETWLASLPEGPLRTEATRLNDETMEE